MACGHGPGVGRALPHRGFAPIAERERRDLQRALEERVAAAYAARGGEDADEDDDDGPPLENELGDEDYYEESDDDAEEGIEIEQLSTMTRGSSGISGIQRFFLTALLLASLEASYGRMAQFVFVRVRSGLIQAV